MSFLKKWFDNISPKMQAPVNTDAIRDSVLLDAIDKAGTKEGFRWYVYHNYIHGLVILTDNHAALYEGKANGASIRQALTAFFEKEKADANV